MRTRILTWIWCSSLVCIAILATTAGATDIDTVVASDPDSKCNLAEKGHTLRDFVDAVKRDIFEIERRRTNEDVNAKLMEQQQARVAYLVTCGVHYSMTLFSRLAGGLLRYLADDHGFVDVWWFMCVSLVLCAAAYALRTNYHVNAFSKRRNPLGDVLSAQSLFSVENDAQHKDVLQHVDDGDENSYGHTQTVSPRMPVAIRPEDRHGIHATITDDHVRELRFLNSATLPRSRATPAGASSDAADDEDGGSSTSAPTHAADRLTATLHTICEQAAERDWSLHCLLVRTIYIVVAAHLVLAAYCLLQSWLRTGIFVGAITYYVPGVGAVVSFAAGCLWYLIGGIRSNASGAKVGAAHWRKTVKFVRYTARMELAKQARKVANRLFFLKRLAVLGKPLRDPRAIPGDSAEAIQLMRTMKLKTEMEQN